MHKQRSFPLRIVEEDRRCARRLAERTGLSENRSYADLIHEELFVRKQTAYFEKVRALQVPAEEAWRCSIWRRMSLRVRRTHCAEAQQRRRREANLNQQRVN